MIKNEKVRSHSRARVKIKVREFYFFFTKKDIWTTLIFEHYCLHET